MNNKEPFDYNKCMERGGYAITRDGRRVRLLCGDAPGTQPVIGHTVNGYVVKAYPDGMTDSPGRNKATFDLFTPPPEPKRIQGWLNIYSDGNTGELRETKAEADRLKYTRFNRIACLYIDTYEGEGITDCPAPDRIVAVVPDRDIGGFTKGKACPVTSRNGDFVAVKDDEGIQTRVHVGSFMFQPIQASKVYAVTDYEHSKHITAGKVYEVINPDKRGFWFAGDDGDVHFTLWRDGFSFNKSCNWTRINGADYA